MLANERGWTIAIAGECMLTREFREHSEPEFLELRDLMRSADVCYGHLEMNLGEFGKVYPARGNWSGSFMLADPKIAKDLNWLGINMMSLAHNHSFDYGPSGLLSTIDACHEAQIACAGTGSSLETARRPAYWDGAGGRVALISTAAGNAATDYADLSKSGLKTRPGINPLRVEMVYHLPGEMAEKVKEIGRRLNILEEYNPENGLNPGEFRLMTPSEDAASGYGVFAAGDKYAVDTRCHKGDLDGNLRSIAEAKQMSDFVMVAQHFNYSDGTRKDTPPTAAVEFAHAAIDAGADVYLGHGWHKTLGVEIYKGKPIFYGLGNFFMESHYVRRLAYDTYETRGITSGNQPVPKPSESPHPGITQPPQSISLTSALIKLYYAPGKKLRAIDFYPVEMGLGREKEGTPINRPTGTKYAEGRPILAKGEGSHSIIERLADLSAPFGTKIQLQGDIGHWEATE